ncbi:MAG: class I SAM-dependent methyltransferase [Candidatus Buchananbacteria bacterium]|nr:class I SAM-dependent methyltransferase [Candidatus Buchananbacteria bacterium]
MKILEAKNLIESVKQTYNQIASQWDQTRKGGWSLFSDFSAYIKPSDRILDVGCGNGRLVELFKSVNVNYTGLDISEELIKIAQAKYPDRNFMIGNLVDLPDFATQFDSVFAIASLHHIPSEKLRNQALEKIASALKPGGYLIMTNWCWHSKKIWWLLIKYTIAKIFGRNQLDFGDIYISFGQVKKKRYVHLFSQRKLAKKLKKQGFEIIKNEVSEPSPRGFLNIVTIARKC